MVLFLEYPQMGSQGIINLSQGWSLLHMDDMTAILDLLRAETMGTVSADSPMSKHTSLRIGGPADIFLEAAGIPDVEAACQIASDYDVPLHIMGNGSNLLVADGGVRGIVARIGRKMSWITPLPGHPGMLEVGAGTSNRKVAKYAMEEELSGYEFACGIPGNIGGAAFMNAGAGKFEFGKVCRRLTCLDTSTHEIIEMEFTSGDWGYRRSPLQGTDFVVLSAVIELAPQSDSTEIYCRMREHEEMRRATQPLNLPSAGSAFKRPEKGYASKMIEESGLKGFRIGGAQISDKHAGFIVNRGNATADNVRSLMDLAVDTVYGKFGVMLEPEIEFVGAF